MKRNARSTDEDLSMKKASRMLSELKGFIRNWAGSQPIIEIERNPDIARRLEEVEKGVRLIQSGLGVEAV